MDWIRIKSDSDLPKYLTLVLVCIERENNHHIVRIRQMGKPNEWFNEFDQSTMNIQGKEDHVVAWVPLLRPCERN